MRKRVIMGLIVAVVTGVGMYLAAEVSGPKRGSVEWHKKRVIEMAHKAEGKSLWRKLLRRMPGLGGIARPNFDKLEAELDRSFSKLEELGYLQWRRFEFTNRTVTGELIHPSVMELI